MAYKIVLDAGHGGGDPGAVYQGRQEKDDTLTLTMAVGEILERNGIDVVYTELKIYIRLRLKKQNLQMNPGQIILFLFTETAVQEIISIRALRFWYMTAVE